MKTTLNKIREHRPCTSGWEKLLSYLGKTKADDEPLEITTILDSNGLDDALWCLRAVAGRDREIRLYAVWCARQVQHLMADKRSLDALDVAERYANGDATNAELTAAADVARSAAWDAAWAARAAAWSAADAASAARAAALAAEREAVYAAETACSTAETACSAATWAAWCAARSARDTAWVEMRQRQADELRRICEEVEG